MRLSIGTPIFVRSIFRNVQHTEHRKTVLENGKHNSGRTVDRFLSSLFVMPYYAPNGWTNTRWTHEFGSSINFLQSPYGGSNSKIGASEGVGVDWQSGVNTKNGWSGPIVYITGKLNIGPSPNSGRQKMVRRESKDEDPAPEVHTLEPDTKGAN